MVRAILSRSRLRIILAGIIFIAAQHPAVAEHGRDFSARYDLKDEAPVGADRVSITLSLRLQNHSGADVADAEVSLQDSVPALKTLGVLQDSAPAFKTLGVFPGHLSLANHEVTTLSGEFTVPTEYITQWRTGQKPRIVVRFKSAEGRSVHRPVELLYMPGVGR